MICLGNHKGKAFTLRWRSQATLLSCSFWKLQGHKCKKGYLLHTTYHLQLIYQRMVTHKLIESLENKTLQMRRKTLMSLRFDSLKLCLYWWNTWSSLCETHEAIKDACISELYAGTLRKHGVALLMKHSLRLSFKLSD